MLIYSYAVHLRKGSYRSLPHTRSTDSASAANGVPSAYENSALPDEEDDIEDFYRVPLRTPQSASGGGHGGAVSSISSFADFVSAPGRGKKSKPGRSALSRNVVNGVGGDQEDVLFDESDSAGKKEEERALMGEGASRMV